jgi:hypothetical protein
MTPHAFLQHRLWQANPRQRKNVSSHWTKVSYLRRSRSFFTTLPQTNAKRRRTARKTSPIQEQGAAHRRAKSTSFFRFRCHKTPTIILDLHMSTTSKSTKITSAILDPGAEVFFAGLYVLSSLSLVEANLFSAKYDIVQANHSSTLLSIGQLE